MPDWLIAFLKIAGMFLVMLVGWLARRRRYLEMDAVRGLSRLVVDVALPALILDQMLSTVTAESLRAGWHVPLLAVLTLGVAWLVGWGTARVLAPAAQRNTVAFMVAIPNWVYLPLPIASALFGSEGQLTVLLFNVGALFMLWTVGVWTVRGGRPDLASLRPVLTNPGLLATVGGILLALWLPGLKHADAFAPGSPAWQVAAGAVLQSVRMVGTLCIPVSLLITGAQLGGWHARPGGSHRGLLGVLLGRLVLAPLAMVVLGVLAAQAGWVLPRATSAVLALTSAMPVAVNCGVFAERFGGDTELAAQGIFASTLLSILSAPAVLYVVQHLT